MKKLFDSFIGIWAVIGAIALIVKFIMEHGIKEIVGDILLPSLMAGTAELVKRLAETLVYGKPLTNKAQKQRVSYADCYRGEKA